MVMGPQRVHNPGLIVQVQPVTDRELVGMAAKRSPITTESPEQLRSLATEIHEIASALENLRARAESFSKPVYDAGWKYPIGSMRGFANDLQGWAEALNALIEAEVSPDS
jgi:hypothetical protein